jgi:hypothetical protein
MWLKQAFEPNMPECAEGHAQSHTFLSTTWALTPRAAPRRCWGPVLGRLRNLTTLCVRSAVALPGADVLRLLPPALQHLEVALLSPPGTTLYDLGDTLQHLGALRTLRLRANMRRLALGISALEGGPLARLAELDLLHVDYATAAKGESLFIFAMIHNSSHEDFAGGPGPFHEFFRANADPLACGAPAGGGERQANGGVGLGSDPGPGGGGGPGSGGRPAAACGGGGGCAALRRLRVQQTWGGQVSSRGPPMLPASRMASARTACHRVVAAVRAWM